MFLFPSCSFCGGLYLDIKRKLPWIPSDFYEGFHIQSISAVLFIYLGCITNAITFGGLLGDATDNYQVRVSKVTVRGHGSPSFMVSSARKSNVEITPAGVPQSLRSGAQSQFLTALPVLSCRG